MGIVCGCWMFNDRPGASALLKFPICAATDSEPKSTILSCDGPCLLVRGFEATASPELFNESVSRPHRLCVVWDGRLDNGPDLARELGGDCNRRNADIDLVTAAFTKWQTDAFERMQGDWAATIWDACEQTLTLARDPMGMRPLFYSLTPQGITWSNSLEWLVRQSTTGLELNLEYLAGWLSFFADPHLTPYFNIHSVPPSYFIQLRPGTITQRKYWEFPPVETLRYRTEGEYEEHFREVFATSVRRRLRSEKPMLAELSGGMDSSSIVCMADVILAREHGLTPRLDTLSYYDDNEPNWNERPYFSLVEAKRGRQGTHVPLDAAQDLAPLFERADFAASPAELGRGRCREALALSRSDDGYGAILSGIGGDEFTGGVPTPIPELADLLAAGQLRSLAGRLKAWALSQRRPWMHILLETIRSFVPVLASTVPARQPASWLDPRFRKQYRSVLSGYEEPLQIWGPRPSFQENLSTVEALRRQVAASNGNTLTEKRYPYLDVDFLQFLFAVPREQLVEPGHRRSLMRRALAGIVPDEILNRKRKAFVARAPRMAIAARWEELQTLTHSMMAESMGIISSSAFRQALEKVREGKDLAILPIQRMLLLERWLRNLVEEEVLVDPAPPQNRTDTSASRERALCNAAKRVSAS